MTSLASPAVGRLPWVGLLAGVLAAAGFSLKAVLAKLAYREGVDATTLLALRMAFSLPFYLAIGFAASRAAPALSRGLLLRAAGVGVLGYFFASLFDFLGLQHISAGLERLVLYLYPTLVLAIGRWAFGRPITRQDLTGVAFAYVGLAIALSHDVSLGRGLDEVALGTGLVFLSALTYAGYVVGSGSLVHEVGSARFTAFTMLAATVPMLALFVGSGGVSTLAAVTPRAYGLALVMAVFATVVPSLLMTEGIRRLGSSRAALVGSVGPLLTVGLEALLLGERITPYVLVGTVLVVVGVLYATQVKPAPRRARDAAEPREAES